VVVLHGASWLARGIRVPARNALLADVVPASAYGHAYGHGRAMDNLGAVFDPVPALRATPKPKHREHQPIRLCVRPVLQGQLGRLMREVGATR
jgi:hypothetical protein